ncbi:Beta-glucosidase 5 [Triticum urartu]|uniref:Beta-glucosidase 5 n=1 Tax=Triticum urartu TaxID=4572 RepID=M7ZZX2_TRIUA|nr:Beta-glucosidase 5 [Triticum urartu]
MAFFFFQFLLLLLLAAAHGAAPVLGFTRSDFPPEFVFGAATSAYQYEGAVAEDGRSPSVWDTFTQAGKMSDKSTGDVAADGYHKYKDDIKLMVDTNLEAYRFSISWSRLIPNGRGAVNPKGLEYYNNLINELVQHGIQVHVMLSHLDFPQVLDDEYGGWLSPKIVGIEKCREDFTAFAEVCFREFGDRVSYWTTIDEPNVSALGSYDNALFAPGRCSNPFGITNCTVGNSTVEPYIAAHNMILAHASTTRLYGEKYRAAQKGGVGINVYSSWSYPMTNSDVDVEAAKRYLDFVFGWILEPLVSGDYPDVMRKNVGSRLPSFTKSQSQVVKGAVDFIGINHYYSMYVNDRPLDKGTRDYSADMSLYQRASKTIPGSSKNVPASSQSVASNDTLDDTERIEYLKSYMGSTLKAVRNGANVKGYFVWSFLDVFEFFAGAKSRYGLYRVDFNDEALPRQAKLSARWYSGFLKNNDTYVRNELESTGSHALQ